jgi:neurotransmitter:Na+ symporter, NSS family
VNYFVFSMDLRWGEDPNGFFFGQFLQLSEKPSQLGMISPAILYATGLIWFVSWLICYRDVAHGIERACKVFIPVLLLLTTILVIWSLMLPGAGEGIKHYLKPDWGKIFWEKDWYKVWIDAFGQIFFTLSLGFGIMIAYASYLGKKANLVKLAIQTSLINCFYSFFAGFAVFGTLGYMSQALGKPIQEVVASGPGLAFVAYPQAISLLPAGREIFGMVFFFVLILAGLSSGVSIIEAFSSAAQDKFGIPRKPLMTLLCFIGFIGSSLFTTQAGLLWLDIVDHFLNIYGLVVVGLLECLIIGWLYKNQPLRDHVDRLSKNKWSWLWFFCIKYLAPVVLLIILLQNFWSEIHEPYGGYHFIAIIVLGFGWIVMTLFIGIAFSLLPWRTQLKRPEEIYGEFAEENKDGA